MPGLNKPNKIIVHHFGGTDKEPLADSSNATAQDVDMWHRARWPGFTSRVFRNKIGELYHVGYHYIIEKDGTVVQCRALTEEGAHCIGQNRSSIGIALAGNFDATRPTINQERAFKKLFNEIVAQYPSITKHDLYPHRRYATKTCFGNNLPDDYFTLLLKPEDEQAVIKELQARLMQLLTQLYSLLLNKRMSSKE